MMPPMYVAYHVKFPEPKMFYPGQIIPVDVVENIIICVQDGDYCYDGSHI